MYPIRVFKNTVLQAMKPIKIQRRRRSSEAGRPARETPHCYQDSGDNRNR
jgi:hypothetical protein